MFGTSHAGIFLFFKYSRKLSVTLAKCDSCPSANFSGNLTLHPLAVLYNSTPGNFALIFENVALRLFEKQHHSLLVQYTIPV